jgi:ankyrin repeat protein
MVRMCPHVSACVRICPQKMQTSASCPHPIRIHKISINQRQIYDEHRWIAQAQYALSGQGYNQAALPTQQSLFQQQGPNVSILNAPTHPFYWNLQNLQGTPPSAVEAIYQADETNYQGHQDDDEDYDDGEDYDDNSDRPSHTLLRLVEDHHWVAALQRITTHPRETQQVGIQGRTPLHVACDHDAPPALIQALLSAWPEGAERVGTSHMNPLHITCSSPHASVDVVRVLLGGCRDSLMITGAKDVDGDTPLHAACRCAAPMNVLVTLLQANPIPITWKDYEGLNPFYRLWVRYFVLVGEHIISNIKQPSDLTGDLIEAWQKSLLLLQVMDAMENRGGGRQSQVAPFRAVHTASSVDCPRCVVRIATVMFPQELLRRDELNRLPIHIAAAAPVYCVHDLRGEGFSLDDAFIDDDPQQRAARPRKKESKYKEPSVIEILLSGEPAAASERDPHGQLPLHVAIMRGKTLDDGVQALVEAHPHALTTPDNQTNLYPFMLAASVGRGRGDCSTIYALLRAAPDLVNMALQHEPQDDEGETTELEGKPPVLEADS